MNRLGGEDVLSLYVKVMVLSNDAGLSWWRLKTDFCFVYVCVSRREGKGVCVCGDRRQGR